MTTADERAKYTAEFSAIEWATPLLNDPEWVIKPRSRTTPTPEGDKFCRETVRTFDGLQHWLEIYHHPSPDAPITKAVSLCKYGVGLMGYPGIIHGGALSLMMDEALGHVMVVKESRAGSSGWAADHTGYSVGDVGVKSAGSMLKGYMVTAKLHVKFLKPVLCPGVVGIEVEILEETDKKMKMRGIMKDGKGQPLAQADGLWVRIGDAKL